eukprot:349303_1
MGCECSKTKRNEKVNLLVNEDSKTDKKEEIINLKANDNNNSNSENIGNDDDQWSTTGQCEYNYEYENWFTLSNNIPSRITTTSICKLNHLNDIQFLMVIQKGIYTYNTHKNKWNKLHLRRSECSSNIFRVSDDPTAICYDEINDRIYLFDKRSKLNIIDMKTKSVINKFKFKLPHSCERMIKIGDDIHIFTRHDHFIFGKKGTKKVQNSVEICIKSSDKWSADTQHILSNIHHQNNMCKNGCIIYIQSKQNILLLTKSGCKIYSIKDNKWSEIKLDFDVSPQACMTNEQHIILISKNYYGPRTNKIWIIDVNGYTLRKSKIKLPIGSEKENGIQMITTTRNAKSDMDMASLYTDHATKIVIPAEITKIIGKYYYKEWLNVVRCIGNESKHFRLEMKQILK